MSKRILSKLSIAALALGLGACAGLQPNSDHGHRTIASDGVSCPSATAVYESLQTPYNNCRYGNNCASFCQGAAILAPPQDLPPAPPPPPVVDCSPDRFVRSATSINAVGKDQRDCVDRAMLADFSSLEASCNSQMTCAENRHCRAHQDEHKAPVFDRVDWTLVNHGADINNKRCETQQPDGVTACNKMCADTLNGYIADLMNSCKRQNNVDGCKVEMVGQVNQHGNHRGRVTCDANFRYRPNDEITTSCVVPVQAVNRGDYRH